MNEKCEFCLLTADIKTGKIPSIVVCETENTIVIKTNDTCYMILPKDHIISAKDASDNLVLEMMNVVNDVAADMCDKHGGCQILTNLGSYQDVKHLHWHVTLK